MTWGDKRKSSGEDKINHDEIAGIETIEIPNETDLIQCGICKQLHHESINHKCKNIPYFSWWCSVCNHELSRWKKLENGKYSRLEKVRKSVVLWGKNVCENCIMKGHSELKKDG